MDALLILGGLLLIVAGVIWLIILAFGTGLLWGVGSLLPPVTLFYTARHWNVARKAVGLSGLGFIPLVVGFSLLVNHEPERVAAIASLEWLEPDEQMQSQQLALRLNGQLDGRPFNPQLGSYRGGVLTLREGDGLFARQEVSIRLGPEPTAGGVRVDVLPEDADPVPEVEINWMHPEQELFEARRVQAGYTLHLDLQPLPPNKLAGEFHLVLPAHYQTSLSGHVELFTDDLRYRAGQVDMSHDSTDTLRYLVKDHLQRRLKTRAVTLETLSPFDFTASTTVLSAQADVDGVSSLFELRIHKGEQGWAVSDDNFPPLPVELKDRLKVPAVQQASRSYSSPSPRTDYPQRLSLAQLLRNPASYDQLQMRAQTERGGVAEGRFAGLDKDGNLTLRQRLKGPGEVTFNINPNDVAQLELIKP